MRLHGRCQRCGNGTYSRVESVSAEERIRLGIGRLTSAYCTNECLEDITKFSL